jgi:Big-like domain-containing protein/calcineurin-like phosphoesterase family protein
MYTCSRTFARTAAAAAALLLAAGCFDLLAPGRSVAKVDIEPATLNLVVGQQGALEAEAKNASGEILSDIPVRWRSSDEHVARVSASGVIDAIGLGTATITASLGVASATAKVIVTEPSDALASTVSVSPPSASIAIGAITQLTAIARDANSNVLPGHPTTWESSDPTVAEVSASGVVTGVTAGAATITATVDTAHGTATITVTSTPPTSGDPVMVGAGDIASCNSDGDEATALLLDNIAGTVFTLGDNVYDSGLASEFANCYDPAWGRHKARTKPSIGNHETYGTTDAAGYYDYFGVAAGERGKGYYSYDLGAWHIVVINNMIDVGATSTQVTWLRADLASHAAQCTLAYWHYPLFSSGNHGNNTEMRPVFQALYDAGADVVLNGHDHDYERFAPQDPNGAADPARGIREFVVGTGGAGYYAFNTPQPNSMVRHTGTFGVLKLTLHPSSYDWQFVPVAGDTFTDTSTGNCH